VEDQYVFTAEGVDDLINILTEACMEAASQKQDIETDIDQEKLEALCTKVMDTCYDRPIYDSVIVLTSCLVRVLQETLKLNALSQTDNLTEH
jgi:hypothetical protein